MSVDLCSAKRFLLGLASLDDLCENATIEEVIFKFSGPNVRHRISLLDNAYFYTDFQLPYSSFQNFGIVPGGKKPIDNLKAVLSTNPKTNIHIAVDRDPCIHLMCRTNTWTLLFTLVLKVYGSVALKGERTQPSH